MFDTDRERRLHSWPGRRESSLPESWIALHSVLLGIYIGMDAQEARDPELDTHAYVETAIALILPWPQFPGGPDVLFSLRMCAD